MTAQFMNRLRIDDQDWSLCHWDGPDDVIPTSQELGFETRSLSTANRTGRIDYFEVLDGRLYLDKIEVTLTEEFKEFIPDEGFREDKRFREWFENSDGERRMMEDAETVLHYDDLLFIPFTGVLVLGRNLNEDLYQHIGYQTANRYNNRLFLTFENGVLDPELTRQEEGSYPDSKERMSPPNLTEASQRAIQNWGELD